MRPLVGFAVSVIAIGYSGRVLVNHWREFIEAAQQISVNACGFAAAMFTIATILLALGWMVLLKGLSMNTLLSQRGLWYVFARSWIARYVPGKVMSPIIRVAGGQKLGYPMPLLVKSLGYETALQLTTGVTTGTLLVLLSGRWLFDLTAVLYGGLLGATVLGGVLATRLGMGVSTLRRSPRSVSRNTTLYVIGLLIGANILGGGGVAILAPNISEVSDLLYVMGVANLAGIVGIMAVFTPAGLGVREGVLAALQTPVIGAPAGLSVAILSRVLRIVTDLLFLGVCFLLDRPSSWWTENSLGFDVEMSMGEDRLKQNRAQIEVDLRDSERRKYFPPVQLCLSAAVLPRLRAYASGKLLDAGCGTIPFRRYYHDLVVEYHTLDVEKRVAAVNFVGDVYHMDMFTAESYDTVFSSEVLEHIPRPDRAIAEVYRVLKSRGKFILTVPYISRLHEEPHDYFRYTCYGLQSLLESNGFRVLEIVPTGSLFSFLGPQISTAIVCPF
jgi:hypothetical protein